jgi:WD40 repeat protein
VFDVFLCHNSADKEVIRAVNEILRQQYDLTTFVDESTIIGGDDWHDVVQAALARSSSCAVFLGVNGWGRYSLDGEARPALARRRGDPSFRVIPVLLPSASEVAMLELRELFERRHWVDMRDADDERAIRVLAGAIRGLHAFPEGRPDLTPARLRFDAIRWETGGRADRSLLYRGADLVRAAALAVERVGDMTPLVATFLESSRQREVVVQAHQLAGHARALSQDPDRLHLAVRLASAALESIDSPDAHAVLRDAAARRARASRSIEHADTITALAVAARGTTLATGNASGCVRISDLTDVDVGRSVQQADKVGALVMDPFGRWVAAGSGSESGLVTVWDATNGAALTSFTVAGRVEKLEVAGDDASQVLLACSGFAGSPGEVVFVRTVDWHETWRTAQVTDAALLPGGARVALAIGEHAVVAATDASTQIANVQLDGIVTAIATDQVSQNIIATTLTRSVFVLSMSTESFDARLVTGDALPTAAASLDPDGKQLVVFTDHGQVYVFRDRGRQTFAHQGLMGLRAAIDQSGAFLAITTDDVGVERQGVVVWHLPSHRPIVLDRAAGSTLAAFLPDGRIVVAGGSTAAWLHELPTMDGASWAVGGMLVTSLAFSPSGGHLAVCGQHVGADASVNFSTCRCEIRDVASGALLVGVDCPGTVSVVSFDASGEWLDLHTDDGRRRLDLTTGVVGPAPPEQSEPSATASRPVRPDVFGRAPLDEAIRARGLDASQLGPDGRFACLAHDRNLVSVWELDAPRETIAFSTRAAVTAICFQTSGELLAVGDAHGTVTIVRTSGAIVAEIGEGEPVAQLAFAPDGHHLAVSALDTSLRLWPVTPSALRDQVGTWAAEGLTPEERAAYLLDV